jgi:hypothetical protein
MTGNVTDSLVSCEACRSPGRTTVSSAEETTRLEAKPGGYEEGLRITGRRTQSRTSEEGRQTAGRIEPGCAAIGRAQGTAYVIPRFAAPRRHHVLIGAVLDNFNVTYPMKIAKLVNLRPTISGVSAAPDCTLETCYSEVGAAEQNEIGIVVAEAHCIEIGFIQRPLVRAE